MQKKAGYRTSALVAAACVGWGGSQLARTDVPFTLGGSPVVNPADFRVTQFASGLNYPVGMERLSAERGGDGGDL